MTPTKIAIGVALGIAVIALVSVGSMLAGSIVPKPKIEKVEKVVTTKATTKKKPLTRAQKRQLEKQLVIARINFDVETAKLNVLTGEARPADVLAAESAAAASALSKAKHDAYKKSVEAIKKSDALIKDPYVQVQIAPDRIVISQILYTWETNIDTATPTEVQGYVDAINNYLEKLQEVSDNLGLEPPVIEPQNTDDLQNTQGQQQQIQDEIELQPQIGNQDAIQQQAQEVLQSQADVTVIQEQLAPEPSPTPTPEVFPIVTPSPSSTPTPFVPPVPYDPKRPKLLQGWTGNAVDSF